MPNLTFSSTPRSGDGEVREPHQASPRDGSLLYSILHPVAFFENTSSTARDHLANERTYLAWLRTSLGLTSVGIAISQLFRIRANAIERSDQPILDLTPQVLDFNHTFNPQQILDRLRQQVEVHEKLLTNLIRTSDEMNQFQTFGNKIGICFNCLGVLFLFLGTFRFFSVQSVLQTGHFPLSQVSIGLASLSVFGILSVTMACIVSLHIGSK